MAYIKIIQRHSAKVGQFISSVVLRTRGMGLYFREVQKTPMGTKEVQEMFEDSRVTPEGGDSMQPGETRPPIPFHGQKASVNKAKNKRGVSKDMDVVSLP